MTLPENQKEPRRGVAGSGLMAGGMGLLFFAFGLAAGVLGAYVAVGFLADSAGLILSVFLSALMVVLILGMLIFALRKTVLRRLFGHAEVALEDLATPLAQIADRAIDRDPGGATAAARDLVAMVLARYSWLTARRWIIASLTGLIAAMAALAGTALLFKQNELIAAQTDLLREQNARIQEQTQLIQTDVQLAEAARNAALAVEITNIASALGETASRVHGPGDRAVFNVLNPATDLDRGLILRINSISRALLPYRFLDTGLHEEDPSDGMRVALDRRRADLGDGYAGLAGYFGWEDRAEGTYLIDRPASPERGQLLRVLVSAGVRNLELLTYTGLTLDYAMLKATDLSLVTAQQARLSYADFSGSYLVDCDFGSAVLENARFRRANLTRVRFAALGPGETLPPLASLPERTTTRMSGADFGRATIAKTDFSGADLTAARFDGALLDGVSFAGSSLTAATFQGTVILDADFAGAILKRADLDGAIVFGADFLTRLEGVVAEGTFRPELFTLEPVEEGALGKIMVVQNALTIEEIAAETGGAVPFRVVRVGEFGP